MAWLGVCALSQGSRFSRVIEVTHRWLAGALLVSMLAAPAVALADDTASGSSASEDTVTVVEEQAPVNAATEPPTVEAPAPPDAATEPALPSHPEDGALPSPVESPTVEPEPPVTPDSDDVAPPRYGPVTVSATDGRCVLVSASDTVEMGSVVSLRCESSIGQDWLLTVGTISAGWQWAFRYGEFSTLPANDEIAAWPVVAEGRDATQQGWTQAVGAFGAPVTTDNAGERRVVEVFLTPTTLAMPAASAVLDVTMTPFIPETTASLDDESFVSPMMIVPGGDAGCIQLSASDVVPFPAAGSRDYVMYKCTWPGTEWRLRIDAISADGWEWAAVPGQLAPAQVESAPPTIASIGGWSSGAPNWVTGFVANAPACPFAATALAAGMNGEADLNAYYLFLKPRGGVNLPGSHGDITIRQIPAEHGPVCRDAAPNPVGSRTAIVTGILAGATSLSCAPVDPAGSPDVLRFRCDPGAGIGSQIFIDRVAPGWSWRVLAPVGGQIVTLKEGTAPDVYTGSQRPWNAEGNAWYVDLIPTSTVGAGSEGYLFVRVTGSNPQALAATARLGGTHAGELETPVTGDDVGLSCSTLAVEALVTSPVTVDCVWSARPSLGDRQVTLESIDIPAPAGWTLATTNPQATVEGGLLTLSPAAIISSDNPGYAFSFDLLPSCDATIAPTVTTVESRFRTTSGLVDGPAETISAARSPGSLAVHLLDAGTSLAWSLDYQFAAHPVDGALAYRVVSSQCGGWSVQLQADAFAYSGPHEGPGIPASNIVVTSADTPVPVVGDVTGITVPHFTPGSLVSPITILNAIPGGGVGNYDHQLDLRVTIPAFAPPGDYLSIITITSSVGP